MENRWIVLAVLFLCRCAFAYQFQSIASVAPLLRDSLGIGYGEIGTLIGFYNLPGIALALPGSLLGQRWGDKTICAFGLALMIAGGVLLAGSDGYAPAATGRLMSGAGSILFNLVITKMVTDWFAGREIVFAMGTLMASWPFGLAFALVTQGAIADAFGWQSVMLATAGVSALSLLLVALLYRAPSGGDAAVPAIRPEQIAGERNAHRRESALALPPRGQLIPVLVAGLLWGSFNIGLILYFSFGPLTLMAGGLASGHAAGLISVALWIAIVSIPAGGFFVQRLRHGPKLVMASFLIAAIALLLLPGAPLIAAVLVGVAIGPGPGAVMSLPARVLSAEHRMVSLGVFYTLYYAMTTIGPSVAGFIQDASGSSTAAVTLGAAMFALCLPMWLLFERIARRVAPTGIESVAAR